MHVIRKHAAPLALLAALLCIAAAPYLIPENPDSEVFRSGTLGILLIFAAFFPVRQAYETADRRMLLCGLAFGLLFSFALSLGSELNVYSGMLPGTGSMLRRLAVPVMAAPLFGGITARAMLAARNLPKGQRRIPFAVFWAVIGLCWLPVLLAYFPGMINYDFVGQYAQHTSGIYSSLHPLLHSVISNGVITLGEMIHSRTFGMLLMSLLQMALFSASLAYACAFAQRRGANGFLLLAMTVLFALHPIFSVMSVSMTKDTLFAAAVLMLSLKTFELIESPDSFFADRKQCALYILFAVCAGLLRSNGVFALILLFPGMIICLRGMRKRAAALVCACLAVIFAVTAGLNLALSPESNSSFQLYSIPAQQLVRAYNTDKLDEATKAEIRSWYTSEEGLVIHEHLADSAKGYLDRTRIAEDGAEFIALWRRVAKPCLREYVEAFLMLNAGAWYPDDLSHATIYPDASWSDKGYLQTQEFDMTADGFSSTSLLPAVRDFYEQICRRNSYQKYPVLSILFCTATPFWVLVFACALLIARRRTKLLPAALGALGLWASYLFGPCTLPRYMLPLFCLAPVLLAAAMSSRQEDNIKQKEA